MNKSQITFHQFQLDLDQCCGPYLKPKKYLMGIECHNLVADPLELIADEYKDVFGHD